MADSIWVSSGADARLVPVETILLFGAEEKYVRVITADASYRIEHSLNRLAAMLDDCFVRVHRRYLVRTSAIEAIVSLDEREYLQIRNVLEPIQVSRRELPSVREALRARAY